jgi:hypothetical protein
LRGVAEAFQLVFASSAKADLDSLNEPRFDRAIAKLCDDPAPDRRTKFPNPSAGPLDGDYFLLVQFDGWAYSAAYFVDRKRMEVQVRVVGRRKIQIL